MDYTEKPKGSPTALEGVIAALGAYASPQAVTSQVVARIVTSEKTKSLVKKILIDPVQGKLVPKIDAIGYDRVREVFNALFDIFGDDMLTNILDVTASDVKTYRSLLEESPYYALNSWYYDVSDCGNKTKFLHIGNALVYIRITFPVEHRSRRGSGSQGILRWTMEFISPTKQVYNQFITAIDASREYIDVGYMKKFQRRIKVVQVGQGRRGYETSYATVPNTVVISNEVEKQLETAIKSVQRADDIKKNYEVNKTIGVLLHGPAGTGKSTIARYLAMRLHRTLILTGAAYTLKDAISYAKEHGLDGQRFIILIEDIDFKFVDRRKIKMKNTEGNVAKDSDADDDTPFDTAGSYTETDTLFQLLDGVLGDSNMMVVATTNYKDRLDPALIRDGRFDHDIEVLGLSYEEGCSVCEKFQVTPEDIKLSSLPVPINPATLQTLILKFKTTQ